MNILIENANQIITCASNGKRYKSGKQQSEIGLIENASVYIEDGEIKWIGKKPPERIKGKNIKSINAKNRIVTPGFIDSHTHMVFSGDRVDEYSMRLEGKSYEEIAKEGGGIMNTVNAVRDSSKNELKKLALERLKRFISYGVTTLEAKSGYGLDTPNEIKMLEVINELNQTSPLDVYSTFLGAHAVPPDLDRAEYIELILHDMIPRISKQRLAGFIDVFCELNYFTAKETDTILGQGAKFGLIPKVHTNQFYSIGGIDAAVRNKAVSADHLEMMKPGDFKSLENTGVIACLLPGVSYFLDIPYAPARKLIEDNIPVAIATDFNPGTCMIENIQLIMNLAAHLLKMNINEIMNAVTINGAAALNISDKVGSIEAGKQADLIIFNVHDYRYLFYTFGINSIDKVIKKGKVIFSA